MARSIPSGCLESPIEEATETFIAEGYRRTQMADVAEVLGVAKGTLHGYVESKAALFDTAIRYADGHEPLPETDELPLETPAPGVTVSRLENRIAEEAASLRLVEVVTLKPPRDVTSELREVLVDLYRRGDALLPRNSQRPLSEHDDSARVRVGRPAAHADGWGPANRGRELL